MSNEQRQDVIIIGGGLAGLICGVILSDAGRQVILLEATEPMWSGGLRSTMGSKSC